MNGRHSNGRDSRAFVALLAIAALSCTGSRVPRAVILITVDTLRADRLSSYGYAASPTPGIDRVAVEGVRFVNAYCDMPWTTGSIASVMTGVYASEHGVRHPWNRLDPARNTLAETLRANGFATAAVVGSFPVDSIYGLDQGFDLYDDQFDQPILSGGPEAVEPRSQLEKAVEQEDYEAARAEIMRGDAFRSDDSVTDAAVRWLEQHGEERFFLWVHYFGPHERLTAHDRDQRRRIIEDYDRDLQRTDTAVARLLATLDTQGLTDETLVVLHSDHGQALGEHGIVGHGRDLYEASVRIPMLLRLPRAIPKGTTRFELARNVDIFPTIVDALDLAPPPGLAGRSLLPVIAGRSESGPVRAYMEVDDTPPIRTAAREGDEIFAATSWRGVREGGWKYLRTTFSAPCARGGKRYRFDLFGVNPALPLDAQSLPDEECAKLSVTGLYDVRGPIPAHENDDQSGRFPGVAKQLDAAVASYARMNAPVRDFDLSPEERAKLESLGYLQ